MYKVLIYQWSSLYQVKTFKSYNKAMEYYNTYKLKPCFDATIEKV